MLKFLFVEIQSANIVLKNRFFCNKFGPIFVAGKYEICKCKNLDCGLLG